MDRLHGVVCIGTKSVEVVVSVAEVMPVTLVKKSAFPETVLGRDPVNLAM